MSNLSTILKERTNINTSILTEYVTDTYPADNVETNLEAGSIYTFSPTTSAASGSGMAFCWQAPSNGIAVVEVWGAGGSTSSGCCCGTTIPGNPGAYSKKLVELTTNSYICGSIATSVSGAGVGCAGCAPASTVSICSLSTGCSCLCAQSGIYGRWICGSSSPAYCCFVAAGYPGTLTGTSIGIICNNIFIAQAYGGDVNHSGGYSSVELSGTTSAVVPSQHLFNIPFSPGLISTQGGSLCFRGAGCWVISPACYSSLTPYYNALQSASSVSTGVISHGFCQSTPECYCRAEIACVTRLPPSFPAVGGSITAGVQAKGQRAGNGLVKIQFIGS